MLFTNKKNSLFRRWNGPLTKDLLQKPAQYGLGKTPEKVTPDATTQSICGFCATGCNLKIHLKNGEAVNLSPETNYPVNMGMACPKGWEALSPLSSPDRATTPLLRNSHGEMEVSSWQNASQEFATRFKEIQSKYGKDSVAFISTGQIPFEEMGLLGAFAKFGMGVSHGDGNTRQCMATSVMAYKQSFGFDAPPYTYQDFEESDVLVFCGANPCIAHPIMWQRVVNNKRDPKIIVVDPRATETAQCATHHYPIKPKADLTLYYALAHCIVRDQRIDHSYLDQHTQGFEEFFEFLTDYAPEKIAPKTGLSVSQIEEFARLVSEPGKRVSFWWTMGINQSYEGVRSAQAIINLCLMTGNIGKPGTGANSITGQCNAMGSRLFSNTTNLLGGHDFKNDRHRQKIADILEIDVEKIPSENSWAYDQIIEGIGNDKIKGLWIIATNTAHSWINQKEFTEKLRSKLEFLVVQDMYATTETAQLADLILPAAGWGEKDGCFINSERRIGTIKAVKRPPGEALSDFRIFRLLAHAYGVGEMFRKWDTPEAVFQILKKCTKGQPCDITGIDSYKTLNKAGGIQWPFPVGTELRGSNQRRLFENGKFYHSNGKARFLFSAPAQKLAEEPCKDYPFILLTGRGTSSQWHTQTRTQSSDVLRKLYPHEVYVEMHPRDAEKIGIKDREKALISSRRGQIYAQVYLAPTMQEGQLFLPMHYREVNQLTHASFDPFSRQPSYKASAVNITAPLS